MPSVAINKKDLGLAWTWLDSCCCSIQPPAAPIVLEAWLGQPAPLCVTNRAVSLVGSSPFRLTNRHRQKLHQDWLGYHCPSQSQYNCRMLLSRLYWQSRIWQRIVVSIDTYTRGFWNVSHSGCCGQFKQEKTWDIYTVLGCSNQRNAETVCFISRC